MRMRNVFTCLFLLFFSVLPVLVTLASAPCRFARSFTEHDLVSNATAREEFILSTIHWEGQFHCPGVGYNSISGLTYDGHGIDPITGGLAIPQHNFSAASKEAVHLAVLALAIDGNHNAQQFITACVAEKNKNPITLSLNILQRKVLSIEKFYRQYPGFGGFLPWYWVTDEGVGLMDTWSHSVPGLDNGEMIWSAIAVERALRKHHHLDLADQYASLIHTWRTNVLTLFYQGQGQIRAVTQILDTSLHPNYNRSNYVNPPDGGYLDDPYEGELMTFFVELYALDWEKSGYPNPQKEKDLLWEFKLQQNMLQRVEFYVPSLQQYITVQKGFWFSSHEQWKYLEMPYLHVPINKRIFLNGERARTWNSNSVIKSPGLYASVTPPPPYQGYMSACGIQSIAFEVVATNDVVTPYGAMPVLLANSTVGLAWYLNMLQGSRMQGPYGSTCSSNIEGTSSGEVITWDSKITTMFALFGGIYEITAEQMKDDHVYDEFYNRVETFWSKIFTLPLSGEDLPFVTPAVPLPHNVPDFTLCRV